MLCWLCVACVRFVSVVFWFGSLFVLFCVSFLHLCWFSMASVWILQLLLNISSFGLCFACGLFACPLDLAMFDVRYLFDCCIGLGYMLYWIPLRFVRLVRDCDLQCEHSVWVLLFLV